MPCVTVFWSTSFSYTSGVWKKHSSVSARVIYSSVNVNVIQMLFIGNDTLLGWSRKRKEFDCNGTTTVRETVRVDVVLKRHVKQLIEEP